MNTEEKNNQQQNPNSTQTDTTAQSNEDTTEKAKNPPPKNEGVLSALRAKRSTAAIAISCAILFLVLYITVNISVFADIFSAVLSVLSPIILGGALAYLLNPLLKVYEYKVFKKLKNKNILRTLSMIMTYVTALLIVVAFVFLLVPQLIKSITELVSNFDTYLASTIDSINNLISNLAGERKNFIDKEALITAVTKVLVGSGDLFEAIANYVMTYGMGLVVGLKNVLIAIFISIYVLISKERLKAQTHKFTSACFSDKTNNRFFKYLYLCDKTFSNFFMGMVVDSLIVGIITLIFLLIFGMPYPLLIATIVCITNIIPIFGPFIGAIPSFFIILIAEPSKAILFLVLILVIQQIDGNIIAPKILGNSTGLSSLGVITAIIIMGEYFGVVGMVVGVPVFAVIVTIVKEFLETRLEAKALPTDTAEYYDRDSLVNPYEHHDTIVSRLFKNISLAAQKLIAFLKKLIARLNSKKKKTENAQDQSNTQAPPDKEDTSNQNTDK